jgi:hypothetical protein
LAIGLKVTYPKITQVMIRITQKTAVRAVLIKMSIIIVLIITINTTTILDD